jgi:hypothetical protein
VGVDDDDDDGRVSWQWVMLAMLLFGLKIVLRLMVHLVQGCMLSDINGVLSHLYVPVATWACGRCLEMQSSRICRCLS